MKAIVRVLKTACALSVLCVVGLARAEPAACVDLFNGDNLDGWRVLGAADISVADGVIVGRSVDSRENSFLVTQAHYSDFELTAEFSFDPGTFNTGIQFRSAQYSEPTTSRYLARDGKIHEITWPAGKVWGYQYEIDTSPRAWTGEIHDEAARGWLQTFDREPVALAVSPDRWYRLKIRARGDHIQTWLQDQPVADLIDGARNEGFIGLQVHGIRDPDQAGKAVRWRNLKLCEL